MEIAYRLLNRMPQIANATEFILGSVAPDAVHLNPDYKVDLKVRSHMFEGCGEWDDTRDYRRWKRNIHSFCETSAGEEGACRDYGIGICVHCLTDYWNDLKIWRRLQAQNVPPMDPDDFRRAYYPEARGIDRWLYQNSEHTGFIRKMLSEAAAWDVEGRIHKEDVERQRIHLLNTQYHAETEDISDYRFLSVKDIGDFMEFTITDIAETISGWLREFAP